MVILIDYLLWLYSNIFPSIKQLNKKKSGDRRHRYERLLLPAQMICCSRRLYGKYTEASQWPVTSS